ncbi:hypothetical protein F2P81_011286 [Scophthalmus maximus]|uniref:Uncharacterized protein n=1 Tax=Scophthalmus maximus TaxID=52904 RepID=A0A6A4SY49_SCOMX|nr:hypothetical protein F2P81_011286 [Scophthalmus maximus]
MPLVADGNTVQRDGCGTRTCARSFAPSRSDELPLMEAIFFPFFSLNKTRRVRQSTSGLLTSPRPRPEDDDDTDVGFTFT